MRDGLARVKRIDRDSECGVDSDGRDRRAVRIEDVAALAGVSIATVSRALSLPGKLKPETLARVNAAVLQTGYTPNLAARNLRARRSMMVLVVVPDIGNPFFSEVLRGIDETLVGRGYGLLIGNLGGAPDAKAHHMVDVVQAGQVDGVLLLNGFVPQHAGRSLAALGVPVVAVCEAIEGADLPQVCVGNREAARQAVAHLAGLGHRRLAYLAGPSGNVLDREREAGFREGLADAGIPDGEAVFWPGDFTFRAGETAAELFLRRGVRPTAVFAANDEMAIGFMGRVRAAGLDIPQDVSVVGFDGIAFADYAEPRLTTFRQPRRELGTRGAELLIRAMAGEAIPPPERQQRLPVPLLIRASTCALARSSDRQS